MTRRLVVSAGPGELRAGLAEADNIVELHVARTFQPRLLGGIFLGRVRDVLPALPGAMIELAPGLRGFLPGEITRLSVGQAITVQVTKEDTGGKLPELSRKLQLPGRLAVWTPTRPGLSFSHRTSAETRSALTSVAAPLLREGEGLLLRTAAADAGADQLVPEIERLRAKWQPIEAAIADGTAPRRLDPEPAPLFQILSTLAQAPDEIVCDNRRLYAEVRHHPDLPSPLRLDPAPDFAAREGLDEAFDLALARTVPLPRGGRVTFDSVEAFTAVDVDLGTAAGGRGRADDAIVLANLEATAEIARQLRLRGIGGAIVIDFISMNGKQHRDRVHAALTAAVTPDPNDVQLLGWTRLGHVELTRRKTTQPLAEIMLSRAAGRPVKRPVTVGLEALRAASRAPVSSGPIRLCVANSVALVLGEELRAALVEAETACGRQIILVSEPSRDPETFDIDAG